MSYHCFPKILISVLLALVFSGAANASTYYALDVIGLGNLNGNSHIDGESANIVFSATDDGSVVTTTATAAETLGGARVTPAQYDDFTGPDYGIYGPNFAVYGGIAISGFSFSVLAPSSTVTFTFPEASSFDGTFPNSSWNPFLHYVALNPGVLTDPNAIGGTRGVLTSPDVVTFADLAPGTYTLSLFARLSADSSQSYSGTISAVPLPGSLLMFGSALIGLGAIFSRRPIAYTRGA